MRFGRRSFPAKPARSWVISNRVLEAADREMSGGGSKPSPAIS